MVFRRILVRAPVCIAALIMLQGCVITLGPKIKTNQDELDARARKLKTILVLTPDVTVNELAVGDVKEERPEWSEAGIDNVIAATKKRLAEKGKTAKIIDPKTSYRSEVDEIMELKLAVMDSVYRHAVINPNNNMQTFPPRIEHFDYTVGDSSALLKAYHADGMLMIRGQDNISTSGRKALGVLRAINPLDDGQRKGVTFLEFVLADKNGDILWWAWKANAGGFDLRDPADTLAFVDDAISNFPGKD